MLHSRYKPLCSVDLPWRGRQVYMQPIDLDEPVLPIELSDYARPVWDLLRASEIAQTGTAYLTVDEKIVAPGGTQRRPHPHVDGCYVPHGRGWTHTHGWGHNGAQRMPIIVAASVQGCRVWRGSFDAEPRDDGDLSHIADQLGEGEVVPAGVGYLLSPDCVHESLPFAEATRRTFIRLALPVGSVRVSALEA